MNQRSLIGSWILLVWMVSQATADMDVFLGWDKQIFSSYVLSTSTVERKADPEDETRLGDIRGLMGVVVQANEDDEPIRVTIICDEFIEPSEFSGTLADEGETYRISPRIRYRFEKLSHCRQATPANVTIRIEQGENDVVEVNETVTFRSIHDCPYLVQDGDKLIEMDYNFAAYVNEQHPYVDKLLREALDIGVVDRFVGYQEGNEESVLRQVYALWDLLVCRDVRYSSITATSAVSKTLACQHVRLLEDTINNTQANCVDGSVLFVSMLRKIGIHSTLVLTPTHCYVGFWSDSKRQKFYGLETTLVDLVAEAPKTPKFLQNAVAHDLRGETSWPSFVHAILAGSNQLKAALKDKDGDSKKERIAIIDIQQARQAGILPIPFTGKEEFVSFDFSEMEERDGADSSADEEEDDEGEEGEVGEVGEDEEDTEWDSEESDE